MPFFIFFLFSFSHLFSIARKLPNNPRHRLQPTCQCCRRHVLVVPPPGYGCFLVTYGAQSFFIKFNNETMASWLVMRCVKKNAITRKKTCPKTTTPLSLPPPTLFTQFLSHFFRHPTPRFPRDPWKPNKNDESQCF